MPTSRTKSGDPFTLTEVSKKTSISVRTLLRYKKLYQRRIPSVGKGRKQRYPQEALAIFRKIKEENLAKRGRPRKKAVKKAAEKKAAAKKRPVRKKKAAARKRPSKAAALLTLTEISRRTGISYPTLINYVKLHLKRIPHKGTGRKRRYPPEAVAVFKEIRSQSRRGRKKKAAAAPQARRAAARIPDLGKRIAKLEQSQAQIQAQLNELIRDLKKPLKVTIAPS